MNVVVPLCDIVVMFSLSQVWFAFAVVRTDDSIDIAVMLSLASNEKLYLQPWLQTPLECVNIYMSTTQTHTTLLCLRLVIVAL